MDILESVDRAINELLPKIRQWNPGVSDDAALWEIAEEYLNTLLFEVNHKYFELEREPTQDEKAALLAIFTNQGIAEDTAKLIYLIVIDMRLEDSDKPPHH